MTVRRGCRGGARVGATAAVVLVAAALAACSSAGPAPGRASAAAPSTVATTPAPTSATPSALPSTTSAAPSATATASTQAPTAGAAPSTSAALRSTCASLMIRVIRGSAGPGFEFAALQFTNTGTSTCVLNGYPTVTLLSSGASVGGASVPDGTATSRFSLAPGDTAESQLKDISSCQAPLSDQIHVVAPGSTISATRPGVLRACALQVSALATPE